MDQLSLRAQRSLELEFVRNTYDYIADDFSKTRYKKWPQVDRFLQSLPRHSLVLDVGCGNGKYLDNSSTFNIGCDISSNLLSICKKKNFEVLQSDMLQLPFRSNSFDAIICVAALHHIVGRQRRQECLGKMLGLLSKGSKCLVQVWAFEQHLQNDNRYLKDPQEKSPEESDDRAHVEVENGVTLQVHKNRTRFRSKEMLVPFKTSKESHPGTISKDVPLCSESKNLRYYHLFEEGELASMVKEIPNVDLLESFYDHGNWCAIVSS